MPFYDRNFKHEIYVSDPAAVGAASVDVNGDPVGFAAQRLVKCRVEESVDVVAGPDNEEIQTTHIIYTSDRQIAPKARIWIPHLGDVITDVSKCRQVVAVRGTSRLRKPSDVLTKVYL